MTNSPLPIVNVEFYGIPRQRAGAERVRACGNTLHQVLNDVLQQSPALDGCCIANGRLLPGYVANLNGQRFVSDPATRLSDGDCLLILSADAGG